MVTSSNSLAATRFMTDMPMPGHTIIETTDPLVVNDRFAREFAPHQLEVTASGRSFRTLAHKAPMLNATMYLASCSADIRITTQPVGDTFIFYMPLTGRIALTRENRTVQVRPGELGIVNPRERYCLNKMDDCRQITLKIKRAEVERQARELDGLQGAEGLTFDTLEPVGLDRCPLLTQMLESVYVDLFSKQGVFADREYCEPMETLLVRLLLRELSSNCVFARGEDGAVRAEPAPYYVVRAERAVSADPRRIWTVEELVAVSGVSARSLFAGFRRYRGTSPLRYVKAKKLEWIHRALLARRAEGGPPRTLTDLAFEWGFRHMSDFSGAYRERFGESPSETLRGSRN